QPQRDGIAGLGVAVEQRTIRWTKPNGIGHAVFPPSPRLRGEGSGVRGKPNLARCGDIPFVVVHYRFAKLLPAPCPNPRTLQYSKCATPYNLGLLANGRESGPLALGQGVFHHRFQRPRQIGDKRSPRCICPLGTGGGTSS